MSRIITIEKQDLQGGLVNQGSTGNIDVKKVDRTGASLGGSSSDTPTTLDQFFADDLEDHGSFKGGAKSDNGDDDLQEEEKEDLEENELQEGGAKKQKVLEDALDAVSETDSQNTAEILSHDPLFLVMSQYFMSSKSGNNLATILEKLNDNLEKFLAVTQAQSRS